MFCRPDCDLRLSQTNEGILVEQAGDAYIARHFALSDDVIHVVELALRYGLTCMMQNGHPQASKRGAKGDGAVYLSFARAPDEYWVLTLDDRLQGERIKPRAFVKQVLINKRYRHALEEAGIPHQMEPFRNASNVHVPIEYAELALAASVSYLDVHAVRGGKRGLKGAYPGFRDEADIERWLMEHLHNQIITGREVEIIDRQFRVKSGIVDILLIDKQTGNLCVLEVKQGRAQPEDVTEQLARYLSCPEIRRIAGGKVAVGLLVAEKIGATVRKAVAASTAPIVAYEIEWIRGDSVRLDRVAGMWPV